MRRQKKVSSQRLWQRAQVAAGRCIICAKKRKTYAILCDAHQARKRERYAERREEATKEARRAARKTRKAVAAA